YPRGNDRVFDRRGRDLAFQVLLQHGRHGWLSLQFQEYWAAVTIGLDQSIRLNLSCRQIRLVAERDSLRSSNVLKQWSQERTPAQSGRASQRGLVRAESQWALGGDGSSGLVQRLDLDQGSAVIAAGPHGHRGRRIVDPDAAHVGLARQRILG